MKTKITKEELIELQSTFHTDKAIGVVLGGVTRSYIQQLRKKYGISKYKDSNLFSNLILSDYLSGMKVAEIAKLNECSKLNIYQHLKKLNIKLRDDRKKCHAGKRK